MYKALGRILTGILLAGILHAAPAPMSLKWNELSGAIVGRHVIVDLRDGTSVDAATVAAIQPGILAANVSSNKHPTYKKGQVAIPREQIASLRLVRMRTRGRIIGTTAGVVLGVAAGAAAKAGVEGSIFGKQTSASAGAGIAATAAFISAGYFIGRSADRQEIRVNILPD